VLGIESAPLLEDEDHTGQPALAGTSSQELKDSVGAKFYCPHALADGNQRIRITEKTMEFSSTVLLFPY